MGGQRRKNRVFAPVTLKMIQEASPRPDDVCEIDGDTINEVSLEAFYRPADSADFGGQALSASVCERDVC
mgnify:CR=1 FL=1